MAQHADATAFTGLFYRDQIAAYYKANGLPEPYKDTARRKIVPEILERRVLAAFSLSIPLFRKTSCAVAYAHGLPDYNGHYGIRDLCDICPLSQLELCASAHRVPTAKQIHEVARVLPEARGATRTSSGGMAGPTSDGRTASRMMSWLVYPERPIKHFATRIHGLTNKDVADAPVFTAVKDEVLHALNGAALVAHNAHIDVGVLDRELGDWQHPEVFDTLKLARRLLPAQESYRLGALVKTLLYESWSAVSVNRRASGARIMICMLRHRSVCPYPGAYADAGR